MTENNLMTYKGNCHCAAFQFEIDVPEIKEALACNCSICFKKGYLWIFPKKKDLRVIKGEESLVGYQWGSKNVTHKFCPTCGTGVLIERHSDAFGPEFKEKISLNVRTFLELNPFNIKIKDHDGKGLIPTPYTVPQFTGELPSADIEGSKIYTGGCHCGAVTLALKTKPLPTLPAGAIKEDNCSICVRNANSFVYPHESQLTVVGEANTTEYFMGRKYGGHRFCKTCSVQTHTTLHPPTDEELKSWPEAWQGFVKNLKGLVPVRLRALNDVEWDDLKIERNDVGTVGYEVM